MEFREFSEIPDEGRRDAERAARERARRQAELEAKEQAELEAREREAREWEREQEEAREAWEREQQEAREAREAAEKELAKVKQKYDDKLADQKSRCDAALKEIEERAGEDRADSLKRLAELDKALADLDRKHERSARGTGDDVLAEATRKLIADFRAKVDQNREALDQRNHELQREERAERGHVLRVPGLVEIDAPSMERVIVTHVARMLLTIAANHVVPGHGALLVRTAEMFIKACAAPGKLDRASGVQISVPFTICNGLISLNVGTRLSDDAGPAGSMPLALGFSPNFGGQPGSHRPQVKLIDAAPRPGKPEKRDEEGIKELIEAEQRRRRKAQEHLRESVQDVLEEPAGADRSDETVTPGHSPATLAQPAEAQDRPLSEVADEPPVEPRAEQPEEITAEESAQTSAAETLEAKTEQHRVAGDDQLGQAVTGQSGLSTAGQSEPGTARRATSQQAHPQPTGVVIWGSARAIAAAAHSSLLTPDLLVSLARSTAWKEMYDGTPGSVPAALDAVRSLEVVVFLDFDIEGGLWIDVDPVTQQPCATLLVDMRFSANVLERFRLFYCAP